MGTGSFPGLKSDRGVTLTPHPLQVPWSRKSRSIPLRPVWAVRPVQSLSACSRVHFTFYFTYRQTDGKTEQIFAFCNFTSTATLISGHICTWTIALFFFFGVKKKLLNFGQAFLKWPSILFTSSIFAQQLFRDFRFYLCCCLGSTVCWRHLLVFCMWLQEFPMSLLLTDNNNRTL